ncbi:hypothetical protein [Pseudomonas sp. QD4]|uniref:AbiU2 domain-containing protein n=1 Tax=Pseudomonas sp. QD4 TaxID=3368618 RepID=UPI003BA04A42
MTRFSNDELRERFIAAMGEDLGICFWHLNQKVLNLHIVWQQYTQLYGDSEDTVSVLNRRAGFFFRVVQGELWDSVLLGISRLTDAAETRGKVVGKNLSVRALPGLVSDVTLSTRLLELSEAAFQAAEFARKHRNKRIAHQDRDYLNSDTHPLERISRQRIDAMLQALRDVLNAVNLHFFECTTFYEDVSAPGGAAWLVEQLREIR